LHNSNLCKEQKSESLDISLNVIVRYGIFSN